MDSKCRVLCSSSKQRFRVWLLLFAEVLPGGVVGARVVATVCGGDEGFGFG